MRPTSSLEIDEAIDDFRPLVEKGILEAWGIREPSDPSHHSCDNPLEEDQGEILLHPSISANLLVFHLDPDGHVLGRVHDLGEGDDV